MTKYFDKLNKNQILYSLIPITCKHEKQCHFGACEFFEIFLDIINKNIFHYLYFTNQFFI